jgi:hypothetical protein
MLFVRCVDEWMGCIDDGGERGISGCRGPDTQLIYRHPNVLKEIISIIGKYLCLSIH